MHRRALIPVVLLLALVASPVTLAQAPPADQTRPTLSDASTKERQVLRTLQSSPSWPHRALAVLRLERYGDEQSELQLIRAMNDRNWHVQAFAIRTLARRGVPQQADWFETLEHPRLVRTVLRYGYSMRIARIENGVQSLVNRRNVDDRMLGVEIAAASGLTHLDDLVRKTTREIVNRMSKSEAGQLSPRLATITGEADMRRRHKWRDWSLHHGRGFQIRSGRVFDPGESATSLNAIARLESETFVKLERYLEELAVRELDIAIVIDCTASMTGELAEAQGGVDDLMLMLSAVLRSVRVGIVGYRDRRDAFETRAWDLTDEPSVARNHLWSLSAAGGGDDPEMVYEGMRRAMYDMSWDPTRDMIIVVIGDAPPHPGTGGRCEQLATTGARAGLTTHMIEAEGKPVDRFAEIAKAGKGRCVSLDDDDALIPEIVGLTLSDAFEPELREFFATYLFLCR